MSSSSSSSNARTKEEEFLLDSEYMKSRMLLNKLFGPKAAALLENTPGPSATSGNPQLSQTLNSSTESVDPFDPIDKRKCREVHYPEFQYATNANGEERQRLLVFEPYSRTAIREYARYARDKFYCLGCRSQPYRKSNHGRLENNKFYAPFDHFCTPVSYAEAMVKQQKIKLKISEAPIVAGNGHAHGSIGFTGNTPKSNADTQRTSLPSSSSRIRVVLLILKCQLVKQRTELIDYPYITAMTVGFREVPVDSYFYGYNADGTQNMRLIVCEQNDKNALREYGYTTSRWYCLGCSRITKTRNFCGFENGILKCPVAHLCQPYTRKEVEDRQRLFEKRKGAQKRGPKGPTIHKSPAAKRSTVFNSQEQSDDEVEFLASPNISSYEEISRHSCKNSWSNISAALSSSRIPSHESDNNSKIIEKIEIPEHQPPETPTVITLPTFNLDGYKSPPLSDQLFQLAFSFPSPVTTTYSFNNPSKLLLKQACEILQIPYNHEAYQFWATIDIDEIHSTSKPDKIKEVTPGEDSGFRAISLLLTGKEDAKIKTTINKWFYKNFNKLGKCLGTDFTHLNHQDSLIFETLFASELQSVHCESLFHILGCRVGVFENGKLSKYGNWEKDDGNLTLLLELKNNCYNVVTSLINA